MKTDVNFEIDEVVKIKDCYFRIVLIDWFTGKLGLKLISPYEAIDFPKKVQSENDKNRS